MSWQHDSSGISCMDSVSSGASTHLCRSAIDRQVWTSVKRRLSASRKQSRRSLVQTILDGLLQNPNLLNQTLPHLPPHVLHALQVNIARAWPPSSLTQCSYSGPLSTWLYNSTDRIYDGLCLRDELDLSQLRHFDVLSVLDLVDVKIDDQTCLSIKDSTGKSLRALRISSSQVTDVRLHFLF